MIRPNNNTITKAFRKWLLLDITSSKKTNYIDVICKLKNDHVANFELSINEFWYTYPKIHDDTYRITCNLGTGGARFFRLAHVYTTENLQPSYQLDIHTVNLQEHSFILRIYALDSNIELYKNSGFNLTITRLSNAELDIEFQSNYDANIKPSHPALIFGEARRYRINSDNTYYLDAIENCSPLVEETILGGFQEDWMLNAKAIKISRKYSYIKINSGYRRADLSKDYKYKRYILTTQGNGIFILDDTSLKDYFPIILGGLHTVTNSVNNLEEDIYYGGRAKIDANQTYLLAESSLYYDGYDEYYYYFHIESPVGGYGDNMLQIIGVNSRKKKLHVNPSIYQMYGLVM